MKRIGTLFATGLLGAVAIHAQNGFGGAGQTINSAAAPRAGSATIGGSAQNNFQARLNSIVSTTATAAAGGSQLYFSARPQKQIEEMTEDLNVLTFIFNRGLDRTVGEKATDYRMGVAMTLRGDSRIVDASYIEGYGVIIKASVPFPVLGVGEIEKKADPTAPATEWERAKRAIYGGEEAGADGNPAELMRFDEKAVSTLKAQIFEAVKNASNLRHLKDDEWISVVVQGGPNARTRSAHDAGGDDKNLTRNTILAVRVRKSAVNTADKEAQVHAYFDQATQRIQGYGAASGFGYGAYQGR